MDPDANLRQQEEALAVGDAEALRALRHDLTAWLRRGGFQPQWAKAKRAAAHYGVTDFGETTTN
jgi:hypothetical protein